MKSLTLINAAGFEDGFEAGYQSGTEAPPINGWDGDLINAIGLSGACRIFGVNTQGSKAWDRAMDAYIAGCESGCRVGVREHLALGDPAMA